MGGEECLRGEVVEEGRELREHVERILASSLPECALLAYQVELEHATSRRAMEESRCKYAIVRSVVHTLCATAFAVTCALCLTSIFVPRSSSSNAAREEEHPFWMLKSPFGQQVYVLRSD